MKTSTYTTIRTIEMPTPNRGVCEFIISRDTKGFYAHQLGELTQWAKVFGTGERKAHSLNMTIAYGNQYGRRFKKVPFTSEDEAMKTIVEMAKKHISYF